MNPYNSTTPATETETFVGYQRLIQQLRNGFEDGNSFAILGGRRCGKTSLLLKVQTNLAQEGLTHFQVLPRYLDIQSLGAKTPSQLFEAIFDLVVEDLSANSWVDPAPGREYDTFLGLLDKAKPLIEKQYGANWLVVLLVDELDAAIEVDSGGQPINDTFFQNLRNLLMVSRFHRHFRLVASGVSELANLISSGSSPLNNLRHKHLGILRTADARDLIRHGFSDSLDPDVEAYLFHRTGRYPYLLQGLLEKMFKERSSDLTAKSVKTAESDFFARAPQL